MKEEIREGAKWSTLALLAGAVAIVGILLLGSMWVWGYGVFTDATANRQGETQKKHLVEGNGAYRIGAYDHFFDLCASVQTKEASIRNQEKELSKTTDAQRKAILQANIDALENSRAEAINQYNVDSHKSYTLGQFKASDLPYKLYITTKETSCTAD